MKYLVLCVTLVLLFFINTAYSTVSISPHYTNEKLKVVNYALKHPFKLSCNVTKEDGDDDIQVRWLKNGTVLTPGKNIKISSSGITHTLEITTGEESDAGVYTCAAYQEDEQVEAANITAASEFLIRIPSNNQNVVEGDTLTIHCGTIGNPVPKLHWFYQNDTYNITLYESTGRYNLSSEKGVPNSVLILEDVHMYDRGRFFCIGTHDFTTEEKNSTCMVRIKDKYAALWPFLGICAEVFVLCAVIFIYEKKRNKTELEESDTDQSPDQKNTPDHGKESNLRHRQ